jgi:hypothetical protein
VQPSTACAGCVDAGPTPRCRDGAGGIVVIRGTQRGKLVRVAIPAGTRLDATSARWIGVGTFPIQLAGDAGPVCFAGGHVEGTWPPEAPWAVTHSTAALYARVADLTVEGTRIATYGDGIRFRDGTRRFVVRGVHMRDIRDDCISNDVLAGGETDDTLLEGCYTAFSARPVEGERQWDGRDQVWTIRRSLIALQRQIGVYKGPSPGHGGFFKWDTGAQDLGPRLVLHDNVFRADGPSNHTTMGVPPGKLAGCSNNVMVWLGRGPYPARLPSCFTITTDRAVWDGAVARWKARHGLDARTSPAGSAGRREPAGILEAPELPIGG